MYEVVTMPQERRGPLTTDDAILVEAARRHTSAFEPLYGRYRDRIYAYMRLRTRSAEDAADLTQQAFLQALGALPQYRVQRGTFAAWLFRIAHNVATDDARRRRVTISWDLVPEALQPLAGDDTEAAVLHTEALDRLRCVLDACPSPTREMLALRFTAGLTSAEIAVVVGKSEAAVKKQLTRIIQTVKEQYHEHPR